MLTLAHITWPSLFQCCRRQALLQYIDVLVFVEATIYQMDEDNEV